MEKQHIVNILDIRVLATYGFTLKRTVTPHHTSEGNDLSQNAQRLFDEEQEIKKHLWWNPLGNPCLSFSAEEVSIGQWRLHFISHE